jgi:hypothetical protein
MLVEQYGKKLRGESPVGAVGAVYIAVCGWSLGEGMNGWTRSHSHPDSMGLRGAVQRSITGYETTCQAEQDSLWRVKKL